MLPPPPGPRPGLPLLLPVLLLGCTGRWGSVAGWYDMPPAFSSYSPPAVRAYPRVKPPGQRCERLGQFLRDEGDPCSYLVCVHAVRVTKHQGQLMPQKMPCAPGTAVPDDYGRDSHSTALPCSRVDRVTCPGPRKKKRKKKRKVSYASTTPRGYSRGMTMSSSMTSNLWSAPWKPTKMVRRSGSGTGGTPKWRKKMVRRRKKTHRSPMPRPVIVIIPYKIPTKPATPAPKPDWNYWMPRPKKRNRNMWNMWDPRPKGYL